MAYATFRMDRKHISGADDIYYEQTRFRMNRPQLEGTDDNSME